MLFDSLSYFVEKLMDSIRCFSCPSVSTQVLLALRVLLVRVSADGLVSLWPILLTELVQCSSNEF